MRYAWLDRFLWPVLAALLLAACGGGGGGGAGGGGSPAVAGTQSYSDAPTLAAYVGTAYPGVVSTPVLDQLAAYVLAESDVLPASSATASIFEGQWIAYWNANGTCQMLDGIAYNAACSTVLPGNTNATVLGTLQYAGTTPAGHVGAVTVLNGPGGAPISVNAGNLRVTYGFKAEYAPGLYPFILAIEGTAELSGTPIYDTLTLTEGVARLSIDASGLVTLSPCSNIAVHYRQYFTRMLPGWTQLGGSPAVAAGLRQEYDHFLSPYAGTVSGCPVGSVPTTPSALPAPAPLQAIALTPASATLATGASQQLGATGSYAGGATAPVTGSVQWSSSHTGVATVSSSGVVTAVAPGSATITATAGGTSVSGSGTITVQAPIGRRIGGTLSGLAPGNMVVLQNNGNETVNLTSNGTFSFAFPVYDQAAYDVRVLTPPAGQNCAVTYGGGIVNGADVTTIDVICGPSYAGIAAAVAGPTTARFGHTATMLTNGALLVVGGGGGAAPELYVPAANLWAYVPAPASDRIYHGATLLTSGQVLVTGGGSSAQASAELFDPAGNAWSSTGSMAVARRKHVAIRLPDGKVLVAGGEDIGGLPLASAEVYDPTTHAWSAAGQMSVSRVFHTATLLPNGKVLVAGGHTGSGYAASADLYDPVTNSWSAAASMGLARGYHSATLLPNGKVLVAGGAFAPGMDAAGLELYDPGTDAWAGAGNLSVARRMHTATLLPNGKVLVAGGLNGSSYLTATELYDPDLYVATSGATLAPGRDAHTATLLPDGTLLIVGGEGPYSVGGSNYFGPLSSTLQFQ